MSVGAKEKQRIMTSDSREMNKALKIYWIIFYHRHLVIIKLLDKLPTRREKIKQLIIFLMLRKEIIK